jgi:hypothetical protein
VGRINWLNGLWHCVPVLLVFSLFNVIVWYFIGLHHRLSSCPIVYCYSIFSLCVCFVDRCLSFCTFSFCHCVVCSSSIYGFRFPLWYLQTLLMHNVQDYDSILSPITLLTMLNVCHLCKKSLKIPKGQS